MIIIKVQPGEKIDRALKRYKQKSRRVGTIKALRDGKHFTKKSVKNRQIIGKAKYIQKIREAEDKW